MDCQRLDTLSAWLEFRPEQTQLERGSQVPDQRAEEWIAGLPGYALGDLEYEMLQQTIDFARRFMCPY